MIAQTWGQIRAENNLKSMYRRLPVQGREMFAAIQLPGDHPVFYLDVPTSAVAVLPRPVVRGLDVNTDAQTTGRRGTTRIALRCTERVCEPVFAAFTDHLIQCLVNSPGDTHVQSEIYRQLNLWIEFFRKSDQRALDNQQELGLFGELKFLQFIAAAAGSFCRAVAAWQGPLAQPQDFLFGDYTFEVKSSLDEANARLKINGASQLEGPADSVLQLLVMRLKETDEGQTLTDLINEMQATAEQNSCGAQFKDLVLRANYPHHQRDLFTRRFVHTKTQAYSVGSDFPRIVSTMLSPAVREVRYSLWTQDLIKFETTLPEKVGQ